MAVKHERRPFEVVSDLRNPGVGQHAREGTQRFFTPDLGIRSQRPVSERYVAGVTRTGRKGDSYQVGTHGVRRTRDHREAYAAGAANAAEQCGELRLGLDDGVVLLDGGCRGRVLGGEGPEAERREQREAVLG